MNKVVTKSNINDIAEYIHNIARSKGWYVEQYKFGEFISLVHSELSEALEIYRDHHEYNEIFYSNNPETPNIQKPEGIPIELADTIIRILDFCFAYKIDIVEAILTKSEYNMTRPYLHGGKLL